MCCMFILLHVYIIEEMLQKPLCGKDCSGAAGKQTQCVWSEAEAVAAESLVFAMRNGVQQGKKPPVFIKKYPT